MSVLTIGLSLAKRRRGFDDRLWEIFAYGGRYGKQPIRDMLSMTVADLSRFIGAVSDLVKDEQRPRPGT